VGNSFTASCASHDIRASLSIYRIEATGFQPVRFSVSVLIFLPGI
jgi:hypothetical protein